MKIEWKTCLRVAVSALALYICIYYWEAAAHVIRSLGPVLIPFLMGCAIAYVVNIPMSFFERHFFPNSEKKAVAALRRPVCMLAAFCSIALAGYIVVLIVFPGITEGVKLLIAKVPEVVAIVGNFLDGLEWDSAVLSVLTGGVEWKEFLAEKSELLLGNLGSLSSVLLSAATSLTLSVFNFFIGIIFAVFILLERENLERQFKAIAKRYLKPSWIEHIAHFINTADDVFHRFIVGQCTEAVILGILCTLGMIILGFPYYGVVGVTVGFTALIPFIGAYLGGAVGFLLILTVSPFRALMFIVYLVILQQFEGNVIYPKVVGTSIGLPGLWVLFAVIIGGGVGGVVGMLLGVPLTACAYRLLREDVYEKKQKAALLEGSDE